MIQFKGEGDTVTGGKLRAGVDGFILQQVLVRRGSVLVNNPSQSERRDFVPSINRVSATASHALSVLLREATLRADKAGKKMATICLSDSLAMDSMRLITCPPWIRLKLKL